MDGVFPQGGMGHGLLNHLGKTIRVTQRTLRDLDMRNYLRRDRATGLKQIRPDRYPMFLALECGDHRARFASELGEDCSGPNVVRCHCRDCQRYEGSVDNTPLPGRNLLVEDQAALVVREVKARRSQ